MTSNWTDLLVGIDDTDNLESRGTGFRVRQLAMQLEQNNLAKMAGITRHQLFVSPQIPYTSHNSSACMRLTVARHDLEKLTSFCRNYLQHECAEGSDAGLCIAETAAVGAAIHRFGRRAKSEVLTQQDSRILAKQHGFFLQGLTGDQGGVIGALAAIGLRGEGRDGRFIGLRGIRELAVKSYSLAQLRECTDIEAVETLEGKQISEPAAKVWITDWARPVLLNGKATLLVEKNDDNQDYQWRVVPKTVIKTY